MTTLYKPVLIETIEQAEALPVGTIAVDKPDSAPPVGACIKGSDGGWYETGDPTPWESEQMVGDAALVPIQADEERTERLEHHTGAVIHTGRSTVHPGPRRRLVTPWEEA